MRLPTLSIMIALWGCKTESTTTQRLTPIAASDAISIQLADAVGIGPVQVPVRQVNSYGVGVPGGSASVAIRGAGSIASSEVLFDAYGYAELTVDVIEGGLVEVQVQSAENTEDIGPPARVFGMSNDMPDLPLAPTFLANETVSAGQWLVTGTNGLAAGGDNEIWWLPAEQGTLPHQVADLPFFIDGMWSAHIDSDAIADLVVWADTHVILLRGRPNGGYGWGGAWTSGARDIAGVVANDINGDRLTDIVVAASTDAASVIEVLIGDGRWNFQMTDPLTLSYPVDGITAADDDRNGDPDITILSGASGVLRRYTITENGWVGGSPPEIAQYKADPGSVLLPPLDLNNRGAPEIAVIGPSGSGEQALVFYVLGTPPTKYPLSFGPFDATFADLDGNGADDLIALEDDVLNAIRFTEDGNKFISQSTMGMGDRGPIAAQDFTGDGLADLAILEQGITVREGTVPEIGGWSVTTQGMRSYSLNLMGPVSIADLNADGAPDIIGITNAAPPPGLDPEVRIWSFVTGEDGLPALQTGDVNPLQPGALLDFAHCNNNVYTLIAGPESQTLHRTRVTTAMDTFALEDVWGAMAVSGDMIACGRASVGANGVAVGSHDGTWTVYNNDGSIAGSDVGVPGYGIAMADTDGDGIDEVYSCEEMGCQILGADFNGDGIDEVVRSNNLTTTVDTNGGQQIVNGRGFLSTGDINDDGHLDLMTFDQYTGTLSFHRGLQGTLAPSWAIRTERELEGPAFLADVDGDGSLDFISVDDSGKLLHSKTGE